MSGLAACVLPHREIRRFGLTLFLVGHLDSVVGDFGDGCSAGEQHRNLTMTGGDGPGGRRVVTGGPRY